MILPPDIYRIINSKDTNILLDWSKIIFFFRDNKDKLTIRQKRQFYKRSEEYRTFWNTERFEDTQINKNGAWVPAQNRITPLNIEIKDINPNDLYTDRSIHETTFTEEIFEWILSCVSIGNVRFQISQFLSIIFQKV